MNKLTNQGKQARCTAHATINAIEQLVGVFPQITPDDLWDATKRFFGADVVSETEGTKLFRVQLMAQPEFPNLEFTDLESKRGIVERDFTEDELKEIEKGTAVAVIGSNLHALAVIGARKSWLRYWQICVEDSDGSRPKWRGLWRYRMAPMQISMIRFRK